jgi:hypothetical protein
MMQWNRTFAGMGFLPLGLLVLFVACGGGGEVDASHDAPSIAARVPAYMIPHSIIADTAGLEHDLRIIEGKLGRLGPGVRDNLVTVEVTYFTFADSACTVVDTQHLRTGILLVHACVAEDVRAIFAGLQRDTFPIAKVIPINRYGLNADSTGWNDAASMADNNTSAFNYRGKAHVPEISKHAQGIAIDINPLLNPLVRQGPGGVTREPAAGRYTPDRPGTLTRMNITKHLAPRGWAWGGRWKRPQDHQHIEKVHGRCEHLRERIR